MSNFMNTVFYKKPKRNVFDLSHDRKFSTDFGRLTPVMCTEVLPSDKFIITPSMLLRFAPLMSPVMHQFQAYVHYFFVPNRIVWENWEEFITGGEDGSANPDFPVLPLTKADECSLADYMNVSNANNRILQNSQFDGEFNVSAIPFAGLFKIWNEYYRDQNLQPDTLPDQLEDGEQTNEDFLQVQMKEFQLIRAWRHDYFTSALPFAQKGVPVSIPIGTSADLVFSIPQDHSEASQIYGTENADLYGNNNPFHTLGTNATDLSNYPSRYKDEEGDYGYVMNQTDVVRGERRPVAVDVTRHTYVDLTTATANTINDLRRAFRLQEWLEKNARGGTRYIELLKVHFGVNSKDSRLQRPEYIGGIRLDIQISEVLQTSSPTISDEESDTPTANMAGHGVGATQGKTFSKYCEEHGYIIGLLSVLPKGNYQQGVERHYLKNDRFDFFWQEFAHIGEQPVYDAELYATNEASKSSIFGYQPRYAEYRYIPSTVHGDFKKTLDFWHFGRIFTTKPNLNSNFIECKPGKRIFTIADLPTGSPVRDYDSIYIHLFNRIKAIRPIPKFGIPSF